MPKLRQPTPADVILLVVLLFVGVQLVQSLVAYFDLAASAIRFPYPLDYGEGPVLDQVIRLARGTPIYPLDLSTPPWNITNAPPLFHLLQVPLAQEASFAAGRVISFVSALASAIAIVLIVSHLTRDWIASIVAGAAFFVFPHVAFWSVLNRVDTLGLALSLWGLFVVARFGQDSRGALLAGVLFALAACVRPAFVFAAPATSLVYLLHLRARKQAAMLLGVTLGVTAALYGLLTVLTNGGLWLHVFAANVAPWEVPRLLDALINIGVHSAFVLIGGLAYLVLDRTMAEHSRAWPLVMPYLIFGFMSSWLAGRVGSSWNDLYELVAGFCLLAGVAIAWFGRNPWFKAGALIVLAFQLTDLSEWSGEVVYTPMTERMGMQRELDRVDALIKEMNGEVLIDEHMGMLPRNGLPIQIQPFEFKQLGEAGLWDETGLIDRINRRQYRAVLLYEPIGGTTLIVQRWTPMVREAIYANYELTDRLADILVYTPK